MQAIPTHLAAQWTQQFSSFLEGADLWANSSKSPFQVFSTNKFPVQQNVPLEGIAQIPKNLVLGRRMEHFMRLYLKTSGYKVLAQGLQIRAEKQTLGELDFLIQAPQSQEIIHLEQVYKFYIYLPESVPGQGHWLGPNRRDSLVKKMQKLQAKQFPLLYQAATQPFLAPFNINIEQVQQQLNFKAQLYLPWITKEQVPSPLSINPACIAGHWLSLADLDAWVTQLDGKQTLCYLPDKQDWGSQAHAFTHWETYTALRPKIQTQLEQKRAPMCWLKSNANSYQRFFIVWWA